MWILGRNFYIHTFPDLYSAMSMKSMRHNSIFIISGKHLKMSNEALLKPCAKFVPSRIRAES